MVDQDRWKWQYEWNKTYGGSANEWGPRFIQHVDGLGTLLSVQHNRMEMESSDVWMIRVDTNGNEIWNRTFGGTGFDGGRDVDVFLMDM